MLTTGSTRLPTAPFPFCRRIARTRSSFRPRTAVPWSSSFGNCPASDQVIRSPAEFQQHVLDVARLVGCRLLQTRIAFLASGDVLRRPADDVMTYLEVLGRVLTIAPACAGPVRASVGRSSAYRGHLCLPG